MFSSNSSHIYDNTSVDTIAQLNDNEIVGGKKMINLLINKRKFNSKKRLNKTGTRGRGTFLRNWSKQTPSYHQRTNMLKTCGKRCFLGPRKTFPICTKNTCKRNKKGIYAAYIRAQEYITIKPLSQKYRRISRKARKLLHT
jgi:hypothetical protein